jgi:hypothetical protein
MKRVCLVGAFLAVAVAIAVSIAAAAPPTTTPRLVAGEPHGKVPPRDAGHRPGGGNSPLMSFHGGVILPTATIVPIFWGTSWNDSNFVADKISGLDSFYSGYSGSNFAATNIEYTGNNGQVTTNATTPQGHVLDTDPGPTKAPSTSAVLAEVSKQVTSGKIALDPDGNGYYPVYTDLRRGHNGYCAWHSYGTINGTRVQFAFFFNLDGDPGCDPSDTTTGHSQGLAALANVSGHELSEAVTDPASPGAWYDSSGAENADKCAWTFNVPSVTFKNGTRWKLQGNWSNTAYTAGTGYANSSGDKGCLDGH